MGGVFCKIVIADRLAIIVDTVYADPGQYNGLYIAFATILFSFQIYGDFYGYTTMARGAAIILGFQLVENFEAPYFSCSVKEFWRRWHISLSGWFRDYLYIPLGGNRCRAWRQKGNLLFVFMISGLWHGASLSYVLWGFLNGFYQVAADYIRVIYRKVKMRFQQYIAGNCVIDSMRPEIDAMKRGKILRVRIIKGSGTFLLVTFAWLFFRAGGIQESVMVVKQMVSCFNWYIFFDGSIYELGVNKEYMYVLYGAILILMLVDYQKYKGGYVLDMILVQPWWFRSLCIIGLLSANLIFGCYGEIYDTQQFIYFQF